MRGLIEKVKEWITEGYVNTSVWKRLQNCVSADVLPSFRERSELRRRSLSTEPLTFADVSSATDDFTGQLEASGISAGKEYNESISIQDIRVFPILY